MGERTLNFGSDATDADYQIRDSDPSGANLVVEHLPTGATFEYNATANQWEFGDPIEVNGGDIVDGSVTVYDASTDTVGDGTTSADHASVTTEKLDTSSGYTWQDVTGSRSLDTWFTAPSDRDIKVQVSGQSQADSTEINFIPNVNTLQSEQRIQFQHQTVDNAEDLSAGEFTVPAGREYRIELFGDTADINIVWWELR